jgi:hypothetical protein
MDVTEKVRSGKGVGGQSYMGCACQPPDCELARVWLPEPARSIGRKTNNKVVAIFVNIQFCATT